MIVSKPGPSLGSYAFLSYISKKYLREEASRIKSILSLCTCTYVIVHTREKVTSITWIHTSSPTEYLYSTKLKESMCLFIFKGDYMLYTQSKFF